MVFKSDGCKVGPIKEIAINTTHTLYSVSNCNIYLNKSVTTNETYAINFIC